MSETLFPQLVPLVLPDPEPRDKLSADRRRTLRQRGDPKCLFVPWSMSADDYEKFGPPRLSHSSASDVRAWWPGCTDWELGDPSVSADAARWTPGVA